MATEELTKLSIDNTPKTDLPSGVSETPAETYDRISAVAENFGSEESTQKNDRGGIDKNNRPSTGINRTIRTTGNEQQAPDFYKQAYSEEERAAQKEINAINKYAAESLEAAQPRQDERLRETQAVNTLTGLAGSSEANVATEKTTAINKKEDDLIRAEAAMKVQNILGKVSEKALQKAQFDRESYYAEIEQTESERQARLQEDVDMVSTLAMSGVDAESYKTQDPEAYAYLAESMGGEEVLKAQFTLNRPVESVLDKRIEGGKYVIAYQNPISGAVRIESVDLGLPVGYSKTIDAGNRILAIPDNWDGDPSQLVTINKGLTPGQALDAGGGSGGGEPSGSVLRDVESIMNGTLNLQDISVKDNYRAIVAGELNKRVQEAEAAGDIYGMMAGSAAYDKEVSDTFLQSMEKTIGVLNQLGTLQTNISGTDTGPITGAFRGANPWDTNAQTIKAQLNAVVPNLARGVYGEVGVLTDNDIRTYSKTLPNLTATEDVRNAILYITLDMIRKNIANKIQTQAAGQRDMSRFAPIYQSVVAESERVLSMIPGAIQGVPSIESSGQEQTVILVDAEGNQFDASDLTAEEVQEALSAGYQQL